MNSYKQTHTDYICLISVHKIAHWFFFTHYLLISSVRRSAHYCQQSTATLPTQRFDDRQATEWSAGPFLIATVKTTTVLTRYSSNEFNRPCTFTYQVSWCVRTCVQGSMLTHSLRISHFTG